MTIDSTSGTLNITAPIVSSNTEFVFYISSAISGFSSPVQKLIRLTVLKCTSSNWQKWTNTSNSTCEICKSGYNLSTGTWITPSQISPHEVESDAARSLSTTTKVVVGITILITVITSLLNLSSLANLWMSINQLQLFF